jgi:hypothetical protein
MYNIIDFNQYNTTEEYQLCILQAFNVDSVDISIIYSTQDKLYKQINCHNKFNLLKPILTTLANKWMVNDMQVGFTTLFSYDYFYFTNQLIKEFINNNIICEKTISNLNNIISNN